MFTSVIGALTSLLPRYFIFGSYVPVLIFSFVNLGLVYLFSAWGRLEIEFWLRKSAPLSIAVAFVATVSTAYVVSAINDFLRAFLEGKYLWRLGVPFCYGERRRREEFGKTYATARRQRYILSQLVKRWETRLRDAAVAVKASVLGPYDPRPLDRLRATVARGALGGTPDPLSDKKFKELCSVVDDAFTSIIWEIGTVDASGSDTVDCDRRDVLLLTGTVLDSLTETEYESATTLYTRFGNDPVKPTRLGNIAAAINSYAIGRYKMELTLFFSRLQTVLTKSDDKGASLILNAKAQLDFLVACCWFSAITTGIWCVLLFWYGGLPVAFLIVGIAGFVLTAGFYLSAGANYLAYGEIVRAAIDVNRFSLLRALDVKIPDSLREERALWSAMSGLAFSGGDTVEFSYEHPAAPPAKP